MTDNTLNKDSHDTVYFDSDSSAEISKPMKYQMAIDGVNEKKKVGKTLIIIGATILLLMVIFTMIQGPSCNGAHGCGLGLFLLDLPISILGIVFLVIGAAKKSSARVDMKIIKKHKIDNVKIDSGSSGKSILRYICIAFFATVAVVSLIFISMGPVPVALFIISILIVMVALLHRGK